MGKTMVVRYQTRPDAAEENQRLVEQVFAQLANEDPGGLRYATFRLDDGVSFIHVAITEGDSSPLQQLSAFKQFSSTIGERVVDRPAGSGATVVGSYRFFDE
jgi:hypothetical protein